MKECGKYERLFEKALYNELTKTEDSIFNKHLTMCSDCTEKFQQLKNTISTIKKYHRPEPDEFFMNSFWNMLEPKLEKKENPLKKFSLNFIRLFRFEFYWKYQLAGGLALLVIGFVIGKYLMSENELQTHGLYSGKNKMEVNGTSANIEAAKYIERSKILLLGIMNFDAASDDIETINLRHIQKISRELVNQTSTLKAELENPSQQQLKRLISDLELILLQIANLGEKKDVDSIELIKDGVNTRSIFLKINIQQLEEGNKKFNEQKNKTGKENKINI